MAYAYMGKILRVDLASGQVASEEINWGWSNNDYHRKRIDFHDY